MEISSPAPTFMIKGSEWRSIKRGRLLPIIRIETPAARGAGAPQRGRSVLLACLMKPANQRRRDVGMIQIKIVVSGHTGS